MNVYEIVTDKVLAQIAQGVPPWRKPWKDGAPRGAGVFPTNIATGKAYRGANVWLLMSEYESQWWGSYKQIAAASGQVRKGEKASLAVFWKKFDTPRTVKPDENGEVSDKAMREAQFMLRYYSVFNIAQADWPDGLPKRVTQGAIVDDDADAFDPIEEAEAIMRGYLDNGGPTFLARPSASAYYVPRTDGVVMPMPEQFPTVAGWYETLFHELGHSTGHKKRLARKEIMDPIAFGSHAYSVEELTAELCAAYLCAMVGLERETVANMAAYCANWWAALNDDPKMFVWAAGRAQKAAEKIIEHRADAMFDLMPANALGEAA